MESWLGVFYICVAAYFACMQVLTTKNFMSVVVFKVVPLMLCFASIIFVLLHYGYIIKA